MKFRDTPLAGLKLVETEPHEDARGSFVRLFCETEFAEVRAALHWTQINLSRTCLKGTVRGMHFQHPPAAEAKLIRCVRGSVFDVAVDLRKESATFLRWHAVELCEDDPREIFIPEGFAHGFQALSDDVQLLYFHTMPWRAGCEGGLRHDDPRLAIDWPLPPVHVSNRDLTHPLLDDAFAGVSA